MSVCHAVCLPFNLSVSCHISILNSMEIVKLVVITKITIQSTLS